MPLPLSALLRFISSPGTVNMAPSTSTHAHSMARNSPGRKRSKADNDSAPRVTARPLYAAILRNKSPACSGCVIAAKCLRVADGNWSRRSAAGLR